MNKKLDYHKYLLRESLIGFLYRRLFLYPILRFITGPTFLDIGCGKGIMLNYGNKKSLGIDINNYNIEYLKSKGKNVLVIPKNGIFPLKEESFNVIICDQVLEHIEDPSTFLSEIYRCLKKDGKLIIGVPQIKGFKKDPDHKVFYNQDFLRCKLKRYNFTYKYHFYLPFPLKIFGNFLTQQYMYTIFRKVV